MDSWRRPAARVDGFWVVNMVGENEDMAEGNNIWYTRYVWKKSSLFALVHGTVCDYIVTTSKEQSCVHSQRPNNIK